MAPSKISQWPIWVQVVFGVGIWVVLTALVWGVYSLRMSQLTNQQQPQPVVAVPTAVAAQPTQEYQPAVVESTQEPVSEAKVVQPPAGAIPLIANDKIIGYTYPIGVKGPWSQSVPEGGFTLVACGNCTVDGKEATSDGTQGTVFLLVGANADGSTPADLNETVVIDDYTLGHIQVTFIYAGNEDPKEAAASAVANMFGPPNCGAEGCLTVYLFSRFADAGWETEVFRDPPG